MRFRHAWILALLLTLVGQALGQARPSAAATWSFAASGDSRNCGDIIMPGIAAGAKRDGAKFYWHLGDLRATVDFDEDMLGRVDGPRHLSIADYQNAEWQDFIDHQAAAFGSTPVFMGIGNHETYRPKNRSDFIAQFGDWLNTPVLREQRLHDDPRDFAVKTYYHWTQGGVDFIFLDNATTDQFEPAQMKWFEAVIGRAAKDPAVKTLVVGMHVPLPDSLASGHSMNNWGTGERTGRQVYKDLLNFRQSGKRVYVLSSHSHFYMANIFNGDYWKANGGVLPGWIIGTAGAHRYELPASAKQADDARTNVYGYLLGTVKPDGSIDLAFRGVQQGDVPPDVLRRYSPDVVQECFTGNTSAR